MQAGTYSQLHALLLNKFTFLCVHSQPTGQPVPAGHLLTRRPVPTGVLLRAGGHLQPGARAAGARGGGRARARGQPGGQPVPAQRLLLRAPRGARPAGAADRALPRPRPRHTQVRLLRNRQCQCALPALHTLKTLNPLGQACGTQICQAIQGASHPFGEPARLLRARSRSQGHATRNRASFAIGKATAGPLPCAPLQSSACNDLHMQYLSACPDLTAVSRCIGVVDPKPSE